MIILDKLIKLILNSNDHISQQRCSKGGEIVEGWNTAGHFYCIGLASDGERAPNSQMGDRMVIGR